MEGEEEMIRVYIREKMMKIWKKENMRGRVKEVKMVFVGEQKEIGEFSEGVMEEEIGEVNEVVIGGIREIEVEEGWEEMLKKLRKERKMKGRK